MSDKVAKPDVAPDTAHSSPISDHHFVQDPARPYSTCRYVYPDNVGPKSGQTCGLAEAAHANGPIPDTDPGRPASMRLSGEALAQFHEEDAKRLAEYDKTRGQKKVDGERQDQHGDPEPNMERFAGMLSAYFGIYVSAVDASMVQAMFKISRVAANPQHKDNYDDLEGYAEIGRRCASAIRLDSTRT